MLKVYENTSSVAALLPDDQILIEGLVLEVNIGVFAHEYDAPQPVRFDVIVDVTPLEPSASHDMNNVVRYDHIVSDIKAIINAGHIDLVETLAEKVASACLDYGRAQQVQVSVLKPSAIPEAEAVGVKIIRRRAQSIK